MLLTVLFGELLTILILVSLLQIVRVKSLHILIYLVLLISFTGVAFYTMNPSKVQMTGSFPFFEKVSTVKADYHDTKPQVSMETFKENESDYDYVTFTELSENNQLYRGKLIYQWGKVKKVKADDVDGRQLVLDLNESNSADLVIVNYQLSDLAKGISNVKVNDRIKVFGEGSHFGAEHHVPVIDANFISRC